MQCYFIFLHKKLSIKSLLMLLFVCLIGFLVLPGKQLLRFESLGRGKISLQRLLYRKNGLEMLNDHPFMGVGYYNFASYYQTRYPEDVLCERAQLPHNIFIQVSADLGYFGLLIYVILSYLLFKHSKNTRIMIEQH